MMRVNSTAATCLVLLALAVGEGRAEMIVDYRNLGDFSAASVTVGGVSASSLGVVNISSQTGLGVGSVHPALLDKMIDSTEPAYFVFDRGPAIDVIVELSGKDAFVPNFDRDFDGVVYEFFVTAFDEASSLSSSDFRK